MVKLTNLGGDRQSFRGDIIDIDLEGKTLATNGDQLPSVDEYRFDRGLTGRVRSSNSSSNGNTNNIHDNNIHDDGDFLSNPYASNNWKDRAKAYGKRLLLISIPIVFLATIFMVGLWLGDGSGQAEKLLGPTDPDQFVAAPTTAPVSDADSRLDAVISFITREGFSDAADLQTLQSPQWNAAVWIADHDTNQLPLQDSLDFRQRYALAVFYFATQGSHWNYNDLNWLSGSDVCNWNQVWQTTEGEKIHVGVACNCLQQSSESQQSACDRNTVKQLILPKFGLAGSLPTEIGLLSHMQILNLHNNNIVSYIPEELQACQALQSLILSRNNFSGGIPGWLPSLTNLQLLNLAQNPLGGGLPASMERAHDNIAVINLSDCKLNGNLNVLITLNKLEALFMENNNLQGSLTDEMLASWPELAVLDISGNELQGSLPSSLFDSTVNKLVVIDLHDNMFNGALPAIPTSVGNEQLEFLALHQNKLDSSIPANLYKLSQLRHLDLSDNSFTGDIPEELGGLFRLEYLFLANNPTLKQGSIPASLGNIGMLKDLSLKNTNRHGQIPGRLGSLDKLTLLDLEQNQLTGELPVQFSLAKSLRFLLLSHNYLSGNIPASLSTMTKMEVLLLDHNDFGGNANHVCSSITTLSNFVADCAPRTAGDNLVEVICTCCSVCCHDDASQPCYEEDWMGSVDPVWDQAYVRDNYIFDDDRIIFPGGTTITDATSSASDAGGSEQSTTISQDFSAANGNEVYKQVQWDANSGNWEQAESEGSDFYDQVTQPPVATNYETVATASPNSSTIAPISDNVQVGSESGDTSSNTNSTTNDSTVLYIPDESSSLPNSTTNSNATTYDGAEINHGTDDSGPGPTSLEELTNQVTATQTPSSSNSSSTGVVDTLDTPGSDTSTASTESSIAQNTTENDSGTMQEVDEKPTPDGSNGVANTPSTPTTTLIDDSEDLNIVPTDSSVNGGGSGSEVLNTNTYFSTSSSSNSDYVPNNTGGLVAMGEGGSYGSSTTTNNEGGSGTGLVPLGNGGGRHMRRQLR